VNVRDFDKLDELWEMHKNDDEQTCIDIGKELKRYLNLDIVEIDSDGSDFFKQYIRRGWHNRSIMLKEIDVIRQEEGW
jgi:hypothetical protein